MSVPLPNSLEFLLQEDVIGELLPSIGRGSWLTLYSKPDKQSSAPFVWCALLGADMVPLAMKKNEWDLSIGDTRPGFTESADGTFYYRYGTSESVRPLVHLRSFEGVFEPYIEIDEEFRLYHNLAEDKESGALLTYNESSGRKIDVVKINQNKVEVRTDYLRKFQAATGLYVAIFIDSIRCSEIPLEDVPDRYKEQGVEGTKSLIRWKLNVGSPIFSNEHKTISWLLGKVILQPPSQDKAGIWPFEVKDDEPVEFIIGTDEDGQEVKHTSEPGKLRNGFGANPDAPDYLTPVFFRRTVLQKYYSEPERYEVSDGQLRCLNLWNCQIDNDHEEHVTVFLGDLGRDIPWEERLHWRSFNVAPNGFGLSETSIKRSFLVEFTDAKAPDLVFQRKYKEVLETWSKTLGWNLFLPLATGDEHLLQVIRVPTTDSQTEFDEQIIALTKLVVDSLNEKELVVQAGKQSSEIKGIGKLEAFLKATNYPATERVIKTLRDLQSLRSTGAAHRKGGNYDQTISKLGIDINRKSEVIRQFLVRLSDCFEELLKHYCPQ